MIEVEAKFPIQGEPADLLDRLQKLGAQRGDASDQSDEYFAHPGRNFLETGEAFRIRSVGPRNALTYKGPLLDQSTKSRTEIEVDFAEGAEQRERMRQLVAALGFRAVRQVEKTRQKLELDWKGLHVEVALDNVRELGHFVELELQSDEKNWESARDHLLQLADQLQLGASERRSYLELLEAGDCDDQPG